MWPIANHDAGLKRNSSAIGDPASCVEMFLVVRRCQPSRNRRGAWFFAFALENISNPGSMFQSRCRNLRGKPLFCHGVGPHAMTSRGAKKNMRRTAAEGRRYKIQMSVKNRSHVSHTKESQQVKKKKGKEALKNEASSALGLLSDVLQTCMGVSVVTKSSSKL